MNGLFQIQFSTIYLANLYFNYMIITFGYNVDDKIYNSQVYLYNITSNKWVTSFNHPVPTTTSSTSTNTLTNIQLYLQVF
ncbi:hypothetical protein Glove_606g194 [Diversispora epigaea]|uniref:Uncharacterized protein n=1 Tax=Diversispora epigaea TaxID=1348612 RepID=A0A397GA44_9GLOM|nr:hypothetical protein Glove_606g194 [Diversispora epigaea]